jgi:hypothetical protein
VVRSWARVWRERLTSTLALVHLVAAERCRPYPLPTPYADLRTLHERRGGPEAGPATVAWPKAA